MPVLLIFCLFLVSCNSQSSWNQTSILDDPDPARISPLLIYPNSNDPRVLSMNDGLDSYILHGKKNDDGTIASVDEVYFAEGESDFTRITADSTNKITISKLGLIGRLSKTKNGEFELELDNGNETLSINFSANETLLQKRREGLDRSVFSKIMPYEILSREEISLPLINVSVDGCLGDDNPLVKVLMRDESGNMLDVAIGRKADASGKNFNVVIPYHNTTGQVFTEHANQALKFFEEQGITDSVFDSVGKVLIGTSISEFTNSIINKLESSGTSLEVYSELVPSFFNDAYEAPDVAEQIISDFKVGLGKFLGNITKTIDVANKLEFIFESGLLIDDFLDAYILNEFSQIQLQPVLETSNGKRYIGASSGLISPNGPFPNLSISTRDTLGISNCPIALSDEVITTINTTVLIDVILNDAGSNLKIESVYPSISGGISEILDDKIKYTPPTDYVGTDTFTYKIKDSEGLTTTATVSINIMDI